MVRTWPCVVAAPCRWRGDSHIQTCWLALHPIWEAHISWASLCPSDQVEHFIPGYLQYRLGLQSPADWGGLSLWLTPWVTYQVGCGGTGDRIHGHAVSKQPMPLYKWNPTSWRGRPRMFDCITFSQSVKIKGQILLAGIRNPGDNFIQIFMDAVGKVVLSDRDINIVVLDGEPIFHRCSYKAHWNACCGKHSVDAIFLDSLNCQPKSSKNQCFCYNQDDLVKCRHCAVETTVASSNLCSSKPRLLWSGGG